MPKDGLHLSGKLLLTLYDSYGAIKLIQESRNMVVNTGLGHIADQLQETPNQAAVGWMAAGSGTTDPLTSDTLLEYEQSKIALTTRTSAACSVVYTALFSAGAATCTVSEAGLFNSAVSAAGTMLARSKFGGIAKASGDSLTVNWTISLADDGV